MLPRNIVWTFLLLAVGCRRVPDIAYAPPEQHFPKPEEFPNKIFVLMNDPAVADYMVRDIDEELQANNWRWTFDRPELRFHLTDARNLNLLVNFVIPEANLKETGTETMSFFVNDKLLGSQSYTKPGPYQFSEKIPTEWLKPEAYATIAAQIQPVWKTSDGMHLGFILTGAGFVRTKVDK